MTHRVDLTRVALCRLRGLGELPAVKTGLQVSVSTSKRCKSFMTPSLSPPPKNKRRCEGTATFPLEEERPGSTGGSVEGSASDGLPP
jgi:hypothetical protein